MSSDDDFPIAGEVVRFAVESLRPSIRVSELPRPTGALSNDFIKRRPDDWRMGRGDSALNGVRVERDVYVRARDGTRLCVDVFRPQDAGKHPALLAISPYGKWKQSSRIPPQPYQSPLYDAGTEAGDPYFFARHGYVHIIADCRGTGVSEGKYHGWMSKQEAQDGYDLVEWAAAQPWCDGNVGMSGISYFGTVQLVVAAEQPPHLKAIMPWNAVADYYREATHHGGIFQSFFLYLYTMAVAAPAFISEALSQGKGERMRKDLLGNKDLQMYPRLYAYALNPELNGCIFDILAQSHDSEFYWERSPYWKYAKIKIPAYCESNWWAYAHMHLFGAFWNYMGIKAPKKLRIGPPVVEERPLPADYNEEALRWYDHWLKGADNGVMDEAPVRIFVRGIDKWRREFEWPLARTKWTWLYLGAGGHLLRRQKSTKEAPDSFEQKPLVEDTSIKSLKYATPPLENDLELTGPAAAYLHAAVDQTDANWIVSLRDQKPDGSETEITKGFLKASHRALDGANSQPWEPRHPHRRSEPVTPGEIYEYAIPMAPMSNVFRRRHKITFYVSSMDHSESRDTRIAPLSMGSHHYPWHVCSSTVTVHQIFTGSNHPSRLYLPVIPA